MFISIVDYGMGNLHSITIAIKKLGFSPLVVSSPSEIIDCEKLILPGVGHFGKGMANITRLGIKDVILEIALIQKKPILGICLGMQLLTNYSEEGDSEGLGLISGRTVRFKAENKLKIPHMGWNSVKIEKEHAVLNGIGENELFYFVHSYHVVCDSKNDVMATSTYGTSFSSAIVKDNIIGVQFHPEKSHDWGQRLLKNFCEL